MTDRAHLVADLRRMGCERGHLVALAIGPGVGAALAIRDGLAIVVAADAAAIATAIATVEDELRPRWVMWSNEPVRRLLADGVRPATAWDLLAVHRLLHGGWRADPARVWARLHDLPAEAMPAAGPVDLFSMAAADEGDQEDPVRADGYLRPEWVDGGWSRSIERVARWARLALLAQSLQQERLVALIERPRALPTARSESTAELLCAELSHDGLPMDRSVAEAIIAGFVGPRPRTEQEAVVQRRERDAAVLAHAPAGTTADLRNPADVKSLLRAIGVEVPDTRAWRLEAMRDQHPLLAALLEWRKAERVATTYGYAWLDAHLGPDGRLRGDWTGSDGAAGRMTASAGLHNMPADMRAAVMAEPGYVFVRADLGQIEPRILASVSGDRALARATQDDDMYAPVAAQLGVERAVAKVAVLGAMYGQTTGLGADALRGLERAYPVAMGFLRDASLAAQAGRDLRTYGGRLVRMGADAPGLDEREARSRAAARGRYGRNAMVQGAAAEFFKVWAVTVRARAVAFGASIVLCLHDELLVHAPAEHGAAVAALLGRGLDEAADRWAPDRYVRFVAEAGVIDRWSDAE